MNETKIIKRLLGGGSIPLIIDYRKALSTMLADGKYWPIDQRINHRTFPFPVNQIGSVEEKFIQFFPYKYHVTCEESVVVLKNEIANSELLSANLFHLLALGELCPGLQKLFSLIALESSISGANGQLCFPKLNYILGRRQVGLFSFETNLGPMPKILVVNK